MLKSQWDELSIDSKKRIRIFYLWNFGGKRRKSKGVEGYFMKSRNYLVSVTVARNCYFYVRGI